MRFGEVEITIFLFFSFLFSLFFFFPFSFFAGRRLGYWGVGGVGDLFKRFLML